MILSAAAACSSIFSESSVLSMPTMLGVAFVNIVTRYVAELTDVSPLAASTPRASAFVMPPAHSPSMLMVSLWVMCLTMSTARSAAAT